MVHYSEYIKSTKYANLKYGDIETVRIFNDKSSKVYSTCLISFDIETSKVYKDGEPLSFMYIWQMSINNTAVYGRTWDELTDFLIHFNNDIISTHQYTRSNGKRHKSKVQFFGMIHNISFEWAFIKGNMPHMIEDVFLKEKRQPLYFKMASIIFIDSYQVTRKSLEILANDYCTTQKLVGDLDYNIERSHLTHLTQEELSYCENDVLILNEYQEYYINEYLLSGIKTFIYTQTGIVRAQLKQSFKKQWELSKNDIANMYPDKVDYDMYMQYLFRGGYVHGEASQFNRVLTNIDSFDITSAHPYQIVSKTFPMAEFKKVSHETFKENYAYIIDVTFYNIRATHKHSIESSSKCVKLKGFLLDNGRVHKADEMRVLLTEIDWQIYTMYYTWDEVEYHDFRRAEKKYLPRYVVENVLTAYETKEQLKLANEPYMNEKIFLNSIFGSFVTKIHPYQYKYDIASGAIYKSQNNYNVEVNKKILSPFWGIWTTAYTRLQQLSLMYELDGIYGDTDSDKVPHSERNFEIVNGINTRIEHSNYILCKRYHKNFELIKEIGKWDYEGTYSKFKMLGAKRYIFKKGKIIKITCAGLPKTVNIKNPFKNFKDGLVVKNCKLTTVYNDDYYSAHVDGVLMESVGGVSLVPCDFTINVATEYIDFVAWVLKQRFT